jgi:predicted DNA binding protein
MIHDLVKQLNQPERKDRKILKDTIESLNKELEAARERENEATISIVKANETVRLQKSMKKVYPGVRPGSKWEHFTPQEREVIRDALKASLSQK